MVRLVKRGTMMFLVASLVMGMASCSDDPDYNNVTPPEVTVTHNISGRVTGMDGEGLSATVSMNGTSVTTNADGTFIFENVTEGTYTLKAEADKKQAKEGSVTVDNGENMNPVWNVTLSSEGKKIVVKADGSAEGDTKSETLKGNDKAEIEMVVTAPADAVAAGAEIIITPTYSTEDAESSTRSAATRATGSTFLIGTKISCSDPSATLQQTMTLEYNIDPEMATTVTAQKYDGGKWVDAAFTVNGEKVSIVVDMFTSYALLCTAVISTSAGSEAISFSPDSWDNLYGSSDMSVSSASYTYKIGTEINIANTDKFTSYLTEIVARAAGAGFTTATGSYPINVTLPVGTAMNISGKQSVTNITASASGYSASGKQYGAVTVATNTWNRQHTGGGSK